MVESIRVAEPADAEEIAAIYAPIVETSHVSFEIDPPSTGEIEDRIAETLAEYPWLVSEYNGGVAGYAYAGPRHHRQAYQWAVDVSVYVAPDYQRTGVAQSLYESLFEILRAQGHYSAYAIIALPNPKSVEFHESLGFERVGLYEKAGYKAGDWHDVGHWEFPLAEPEDRPAPPTPFAELRDSPILSEILHPRR